MPSIIACPVKNQRSRESRTLYCMCGRGWTRAESHSKFTPRHGAFLAHYPLANLFGCTLSRWRDRARDNGAIFHCCHQRCRRDSESARTLSVKLCIWNTHHTYAANVQNTQRRDVEVTRNLLVSLGCRRDS
jgi:hypothetical protein